MPGNDGAPGVNGAIQILAKNADQNGITGTAIVDVTGLTVAVLNGQRIRFRAYLRVTTSGATVAALVSINGPTASLISYLRREWSSATVQTISMGTAYNALSANTAGPSAAVVLYEISGVVLFTANGTFAIRAEAEVGVGGTMNVLAGSWMEYNLA